MLGRWHSDLESFQDRPNEWKHSNGDHKASAVALYPGDVWLVFATSTSSLTEHVAFIHRSEGGGEACSYWVARLWGLPLVRESLDTFASSNQARVFFYVSCLCGISVSSLKETMFN